MTTERESARLPVAIKQKLKECATAIRRENTHTVESIIQIGRTLKTAHGLLSHRGDGTFGQWVQTDCSLTPQSARNYMRVAEVFGAKVCKGLLQSFTFEALYFLGRVATPEPAIAAAMKRAKRGELIGLAAAKDLVAAHTLEEDDGGEDESSGVMAVDAERVEEVGEQCEDDEAGQNGEPPAGPAETDGDDAAAPSDDQPCPARFIVAVRTVLNVWARNCPKNELTKFARGLRQLADEIENQASSLETTVP